MRAVAVLMVLLLSGAAFSRMQIVTTTAMIADVADAVAGELADVRALMGPGTDPHLYQATPSDIRALQGADLVLYNGLLLEGQLGEVLGRFGELKPVNAVVEASMPADRILAHAGMTEGSADPHVWMDASLFSLVAFGVADVLAGLDSGNAAVYRGNAEDYVARLEALHEWIEQSIASIPEEHRILVTAHDAFGYYGAAYGIEVVGIQGLSTETEAAVADIRETVDLVVGSSVPTIFVESTINPRTIEAVVEAARSRGHSVSIGGQLYSDAMGAEGEHEGTLIGMLRHNTTAITESLGGEVAAWPALLADWAREWSLE